MRAKKYIYAAVLAAAMAFVVMGASSVYAVDELVLHGVIQNMNLAAKIITIDVKSGSCSGVRDFRIDDTSRLNSGMIGKKITIKIDVSRCESYTTHRILSFTM